MSKHLHWQIKYNYLMRYYNGELPSLLGKELKEKGLINVADRDVKDAIFRYKDQYKRYGIVGLESKTGLKATGRPPKDPKNEKDKFEGWTKEQIIEHYRHLEDWIERLKDDKKMMYQYIDTSFSWHPLKVIYHYIS